MHFKLCRKRQAASVPSARPMPVPSMPKLEVSPKSAAGWRLPFPVCRQRPRTRSSGWRRRSRTRTASSTSPRARSIRASPESSPRSAARSMTASAATPSCAARRTSSIASRRPSGAPSRRCGIGSRSCSRPFAFRTVRRSFRSGSGASSIALAASPDEHIEESRRRDECLNGKLLRRGRSPRDRHRDRQPGARSSPAASTS